MNRNRIIKVILGVLTVLSVVWFCVLSYQDGYARDYGIYRSRTLLLMAVVLLLCCVILFFYGSFFCKKGIGKVQICNFVFLILAVASLGLWGNSAATKDEDAEAKAVLEEAAKDGEVKMLVESVEAKFEKAKEKDKILGSALTDLEKSVGK